MCGNKKHKKAKALIFPRTLLAIKTTGIPPSRPSVRAHSSISNFHDLTASNVFSRVRSQTTRTPFAACRLVKVRRNVGRWCPHISMLSYIHLPVDRLSAAIVLSWVKNVSYLERNKLVSGERIDLAPQCPKAAAGLASRPSESRHVSNNRHRR